MAVRQLRDAIVPSAAWTRTEPDCGLWPAHSLRGGWWRERISSIRRPEPVGARQKARRWSADAAGARSGLQAGGLDRPIPGAEMPVQRGEARAHAGRAPLVLGR